MDKKLKGRIINLLRGLSRQHKPKEAAKKARKVGPAAFKCQHCDTVMYEGKKDISKTGLLEAHTCVLKGRIEMDHIIPVIPPEGFKLGIWSWDEFIERLLPDSPDAYQALCPECHRIKTNKEKDVRIEKRKNKS